MYSETYSFDPPMPPTGRHAQPQDLSEQLAQDEPATSGRHAAPRFSPEIPPSQDEPVKRPGRHARPSSPAESVTDSTESTGAATRELGSFVLTFVRGGDLLEITDPSGETHPIRFREKAFTLLARMYLQLGPGQHDRSQLGLTFPMNGKRRATPGVLTNHADLERLPSEVYKPEKVYRWGAPTHITLGEMSLAMRPGKTEKLRPTDKPPIDFTEYDNVVLRSRDRSQSYLLTLDTTDAILAARVIQVLADTGAGAKVGASPEVSSKDVARLAWASMSHAERLLITGNVHDAVEPTYNSTAFNSGIRAILSKLTPKLRLTQQRTDDKFTILTPLPEIEYNQEQVDEPGLMSATPSTRARNPEPLAIPSPENMAMAATITDIADGNKKGMDAVLAIRTLNFVMSPEGRLALHKLHGEDADISEIVWAARRCVRITLGDAAYESAVTERTIAGKRHLRPYVQQVSGQLPGNTDWQLGLDGETYTGGIRRRRP